MPIPNHGTRKSPGRRQWFRRRNRRKGTGAGLAIKATTPQVPEVMADKETHTKSVATAITQQQEAETKRRSLLERALDRLAGRPSE